MNPTIKAKWLEALRSGRYHQARGQLRRGGGCLGVLCEIAVQEGIAQRKGINYWTRDDDLTDDVLPHGVVEWVGIDSPNPTVLLGFNVRMLSDNGARLSDLNDTGLTFPQIADLIEREL